MTTKTLDRGDTFVVSTKSTPPTTGEHFSKTVRLPGGQKVHVIDREVFDRALKAASENQGKSQSDGGK